MLPAICAPHPLGIPLLAPDTRRRSRHLGRENAHRGFSRTCRSASVKTCPQVPVVSGESADLPTISCRTPLLPQWNRQAIVIPCFNVSIGYGGNASGPLVDTFPVGIGLSGSISGGISYGGSLLDTTLFIQAQMNGMVSAGIFAGLGFTAQGGEGAVSRCLSLTTTLHGEVNVGEGISASASVDIPLTKGGSPGIGGYHGRLPGGRLGPGMQWR